jgi:hypothetical protein
MIKTSAIRQHDHRPVYARDPEKVVQLMKPFRMALFLLSLAVAGCKHDSTQAFPTDKHGGDSAECRQFTNQISEVLERQILEDDAAYKKQKQELNNIMRSLDTAGANRNQMSKATNDLADRQDNENETRENAVQDQLVAIRQRSQEAGCTNLN